MAGARTLTRAGRWGYKVPAGALKASSRRTRRPHSRLEGSLAG